MIIARQPTIKESISETGRGVNVTQIVLIRHGITNWNAERRAQGQNDIPLNDIGREQAHALANRLKSEQWDMIFSSDLSRAKETADILGTALDLEVHPDTRLREMHKGETEGTTLEERINRWGIQWDQLPLGIENDVSITNRGVSFMTEIITKFSNKRILVVSHGALIGQTIKGLIPTTDVNVFIHNTSMTTLKYTDPNWTCEKLNCAKHL